MILTSKPQITQMARINSADNLRHRVIRGPIALKEFVRAERLY
jgi:hypothetical protein